MPVRYYALKWCLAVVVGLLYGAALSHLAPIQMAREGLRFERFYAAAPVCSPTRGSMLTGRHPFRYGVFFANVGHLPTEEWTLAELLKERGYRTGFFGKWHLGTLSRIVRESNRGGPRGATHYAPPWQHGFDVTFASEAKMPTYDPMIQPEKARQTWWDPLDAEDDGISYETYYWRGPGQIAVDNLKGDDSRIILDRALPFIERSTKEGEPFLAVIWLHAPHLPVVAGEDTRPYRGADKYTQHYYGSVTALDRQVGRLRRMLRELGVAENTLLWFTSDNGPEHGPEDAPGSAGPFRGTKRSLYEGGMRVPALIEWPDRIEGGRTTGVPAVTSDVLPTVLDLLDLSLPADRPLDGVSLLSLINGEVERRPRPIAFESAGQLVLSDDRYKIIHVPDKNTNGPLQNDDVHFELYDLKADPAEENNLAQEEPQKVQMMKLRLQQWRKSVENSRNGNDYANQ